MAEDWISNLLHKLLNNGTEVFINRVTIRQTAVWAENASLMN